MSDDESNRTDRLRGVEIDALLRSDPKKDAAQIPDHSKAGDATAQINPADLARLEAVVSARALPRTERNEAVLEARASVTDAMPYVRTTQQSGGLRAVLDQDLREVAVEPIEQPSKFNAASHDLAAIDAATARAKLENAATRESAELVAMPTTSKLDVVEMATTIPLPRLQADQAEPMTQPFSRVEPVRPAEEDVEAPQPAAAPTSRKVIVMGAAGLAVVLVLAVLAAFAVNGS